MRSADTLEDPLADQGLQDRFEVPRRQLMAFGQRLGRHRAGAGVYGDIDDSGNGKKALAGNQGHLRGTGYRGKEIGYGPASVQSSLALLFQLPVEPKPPLPREVSSRDATFTMCVRTTGAITSWAIRMPRVIATDSLPRLISSTWISPR